MADTDFNGPEFEDTMNLFREVIPRTWWNIYQGCLQKGFNERQAFALVETYILSSNTNGIQPPDMDGPNSDLPET